MHDFNHESPPKNKYNNLSVKNYNPNASSDLFRHEKNNQNKSMQKVVIPRGTIDPTETVVIEIPPSLQNIPVLLAKKKTEPFLDKQKSEVNGANSLNLFLLKLQENPDCSNPSSVSCLKNSKQCGAESSTSDAMIGCCLNGGINSTKTRCLDGKCTSLDRTKHTVSEYYLELLNLMDSYKIPTKEETKLNENYMNLVTDYYKNKYNGKISPSKVECHLPVYLKNLDHLPFSDGPNRNSNSDFENIMDKWLHHDCAVTEELDILMKDVELLYGSEKLVQTLCPKCQKLEDLGILKM